MVPVASTVTWAIKTMSLSDSEIASRAPLTAAFACRRSCVVSINNASTPLSTKPLEAVKYASFNFTYSVCPKVGSLVPGPSEPRTHLGLSGVENSSATSLASFPPEKANS